MLEQLGNLGDFVGGIAVVVTLVYLAIQIRQNTRSTKTQSWQAAVASVSEWTLAVGNSAESTRILMEGSQAFESLSDVDRQRYNFLMNAFLRNCENIHYQFTQGAIDESTWSGWAQRTLAFIDPPGARVWWAANAAAYSREFRNFVEHTRPTGELPWSIIPSDASES